MKAVTAMATAPPAITRSAARLPDAPPTRPPTIPKTARETRAATAMEAARAGGAARIATRSGRAAPAAKLSAETKAACTGRAMVACLNPNSSRRWVSRGLTALSRSATARARGRSSPRRTYSSVSSSTSRLGSRSSSVDSSLMSASSASRCELTETYSPAAIDIEPATSPANPATRTAAPGAAEAATPIIRRAVETMPSSAPSTAARSHPARPLRCTFKRRRDMVSLSRYHRAGRVEGLTFSIDGRSRLHRSPCCHARGVTPTRYQSVDSTLSVGRSPGQWFTPALGAEEPALAELHKHQVSDDHEQENPQESDRQRGEPEYAREGRKRQDDPYARTGEGRDEERRTGAASIERHTPGSDDEDHERLRSQ